MQLGNGEFMGDNTNLGDQNMPVGVFSSGIAMIALGGVRDVV